MQYDRDFQEKRLRGHFLLVETKSLSPKLTESQLKEMKKKTFRKLHIVQIHDPIGALYLTDQKTGLGAFSKSSNTVAGSGNTKSASQSLEQIDQLTFTEQASKFINFDSNRGIIFMLNQDKQDRHLKFFSVTLKKEVAEDSDSDDGVGTMGANQKGASKSKSNGAKQQYQSRIRFEYITEVRLQISNQSFSAIQKVSRSKHKTMIQQALPVCFKVLCTGGDNGLSPSAESNIPYDTEQFFVYINILDQVLVFQRSISELQPSSLDMIKVLSNRTNSLSQHQQESKATALQQMQANLPLGTTFGSGQNKGGFIDLSKLGQIPNTYKEQILQKSKEMMRGNEDGNEESDGIDNEQLPGVEGEKHGFDDGHPEENTSQNQIIDGENIVKDLLADSERSERTEKS